MRPSAENQGAQCSTGRDNQLRLCGLTNAMLIREMLDRPASKAIHAPMIKHRREPSVCGMKANTMATPVVPIVCPMRRAMPSIPLAPPLRLRGADDTNVRLLGVWNKPNPAPQNMILHQMSILSALSGKSITKSIRLKTDTCR